jgi:hypothetical protein
VAAAALAVVAGITVLTLGLLGYAFGFKMSTSQLERYLLTTHGYAEVHCRHSYSLGILDWDYHCRVYDSNGRYLWSPNFEVNGHEQTSQTAP